MDTIILQHLNTLAAHPLWKTLSWETRGMALELMALPGTAAFGGTLPAEDDLWRNALNIPTQRSIQAALKKSVNGRGLREQNELDIVWNDVWKPELLQWFVQITPAFAQQHPRHKEHIGRYWHPLLEMLEWVEPPKTKKTPRVLTDALVVVKTKGKAKRLVEDPSWDYPLIRYTTNVFKACWDEPLTREARADLWNSAVNMLGGSDPKAAATARQFIGKLIKEFGEKNTAAAVAQLVVRAVPPADPKSFLRKQLKNMTEGSNAVQLANQQRVRVPL